MTEARQQDADAEGRTEIGLYSRPEPEPIVTPSDIAAAVASLVWLVIVGGFFAFSGGAGQNGTLGTLVTLLTVFLPIALIWIAAITLKTGRLMRAEAERLQAAIDAMRHAYVTQSQGGLSRSSVEKRLDEIAAAARQTETAIATFASRRESDPALLPAVRKTALSAPAATAATEDQPTLALGTPAEDETPPISITEFIKALNFPDTPNDREGFAALRRALDDHKLSRLIRAAQDALTLLSQDGIYMDDLRPDRARPEIWRRFAQGERGKLIAALGGVRDRSSLALTAARMRQDTIFRDTVHHFLRLFDRTFAEFEKNATDAEVAALAETRTARAFMLLGRVTGIFD
ncbi:MAG: hypothetical protein KDE00_08450 [Rhodobacteraceae bacterium]|nr:hypothetical protein [Paracoccaceae bacterium]